MRPKRRPRRVLGLDDDPRRRPLRACAQRHKHTVFLYLEHQSHAQLVRLDPHPLPRVWHRDASIPLGAKALGGRREEFGGTRSTEFIASFQGDDIQSLVSGNHVHRH